MDIIYKPIGFIKTIYKQVDQMPIQPKGAIHSEGIIELNTNYIEGLMDLEGFSHIILVYHFHKVKETKLHVIPFMDDKLHGIFATRAPARPNPIGLSIVKLLEINANKILFEGADMIDGTPLIDIKPFFPKYDNQQDVKSGWLESKKDIDISKIRSDKRFA